MIHDIFVNCNWVVSRWQYYSTHLHKDNTQNNTNNNRTTQIPNNLEECGPCSVFANFVEYCASSTGKKLSKFRGGAVPPSSVPSSPSPQDTTSQQIFSLQFSGAFAKLRKATISFIMSACPSLRPSEKKPRLLLDEFPLNLIFSKNL